MSSATNAAAAERLSDHEVQTRYTRLQSDLQAMASKIGELEAEAEEHALVLATLAGRDPARRCFRLVGGVLVERTVRDVVPALETNRDGITRVIGTLAAQYKTTEGEFSALVRTYNIRPAPRT